MFVWMKGVFKQLASTLVQMVII